MFGMILEKDMSPKIVSILVSLVLFSTEYLLREWRKHYDADAADGVDIAGITSKMCHVQL